jgi:hypothetical protein
VHSNSRRSDWALNRAYYDADPHFLGFLVGNVRVILSEAQSLSLILDMKLNANSL